jgi:hypothetical protein
MGTSGTAGQGEARSTSVEIDTPAIEHAVRLIHQVCCFAGSFDLLGEFRDQGLCRAIERHDTAALFDRLMHDFSFQGISDEIAANYIRRHGRATWRSVRKNLAARPSCPKLQSYWHFLTQVFPRFVQLAIWRYCSQQGFDICNGNRLDDRHRCQNRHCRLYGICDRIGLK